MSKTFLQDYIRLFDKPTGESIASHKTIGLAPLYDYVLNSVENTREKRINCVLKAFDLSSATEVKPFYDNVESVLLNRGMVKLQILNLLNEIGLSAKEKNTAIIARLIEIVAANPDMDYDDLIAGFAKAHGSTALAVSRLLERELNVYDPVFVDKVTQITGSQPFTSSDILCDLAVYARNTYSIGGLIRA
ncbi:MAG: hypothetical protein HDT28_03895 [Clostridiales bacterium]|nr:hypothetical protein [Clostridiales bacterium]